MPTTCQVSVCRTIPTWSVTFPSNRHSLAALSGPTHLGRMFSRLDSRCSAIAAVVNVNERFLGSSLSGGLLNIFYSYCNNRTFSTNLPAILALSSTLSKNLSLSTKPSYLVISSRHPIRNCWSLSVLRRRKQNHRWRSMFKPERTAFPNSTRLLCCKISLALV